MYNQNQIYYYVFITKIKLNKIFAIKIKFETSTHFLF